MVALLFLIIGLVGASPDAGTEKTASEKTASEKTIGSTKKSTDMSFEELLVQGKYHFTGEAVTTVEQDKVLDGLLQVRKDFKDRIQQSAARY